MIKKLFLLTSILAISACASNESKQCDPEKNYIISNPEAMEEYKILRKNGNIKSYYSKTVNKKECNYGSCVRFNPEKFDFIEIYFNDTKRKGIYTVKASRDFSNKKCMPKHPAQGANDYCFTIEKNKNNIIKSRYELLFDDSLSDQTITSFKDLSKDIYLYKISYQMYSTNSIGGPGFGQCGPSKINHPEYKFNSYKFYSEHY